MKKHSLKFYRQTFKAMGCPCDVQLYAKSTHAAAQIAAQVIADIQRLEALYSRYRPDSFLSEINRIAAQGGKINVDAETAGLLNYAATCYQQSDGLFDITAGVLRQAWHFKNNSLPNPSLIQSLLDKIGWQKLSWQAPYLAFSVPGMEIDFGGIVKEYAADRAAVLCRESGITHGAINLGGDIHVIGPHPDGSAWRIGIRHPRKSGMIQTLLLSSGGLASSGDYERCLIIGGVRYGHILNPKTGWPVQYLASVSVAADFCVVAGSAATIAMLKEAEAPVWLNELRLPAFWLSTEGQQGGSLNPSL